MASANLGFRISSRFGVPAAVPEGTKELGQRNRENAWKRAGSQLCPHSFVIAAAGIRMPQRSSAVWLWPRPTWGFGFLPDLAFRLPCRRGRRNWDRGIERMPGSGLAHSFVPIPLSSPLPAFVCPSVLLRFGYGLGQLGVSDFFPIWRSGCRAGGDEGIGTEE